MATIFLDVNETNFNIANDGNSIFGQQGTESVNILSGVTGTVLDANIDQVSFAGNVSDFLFQQQGNQLLVYKDNILVVTSIVQTDEDGSLLTFENGTFSAKFGQGAVIEIGGTPVPDGEPGEVIPIDTPGDDLITIEVNSNTAAAGELVASDADYLFEIAHAGYTQEITGFNAGDILDFPADGAPTVINSSFTDGIVDVQYALNGVVTVIRLTGLDPAIDQELLGIQSFNDVFGEGTILAGDDPSEPVTDVDIDTTAFPTQADFDAAGGAYNFIDDAAVSNYAVIANFSADDTISFVNAEVDDYTFSNEGEDVTLSYNYNDDGIMNVIKLTGVVSSDAMVYDLASFTEAVGFDPFG